MTTLDQTPHPGTGDRPAAATPPHDPAMPFYAVGGSDPDFALPPHGKAHAPGFWTRLISSARRH